MLDNLKNNRNIVKADNQIQDLKKLVNNLTKEHKYLARAIKTLKGEVMTLQTELSRLKIK